MGRARAETRDVSHNSPRLTKNPSENRPGGGGKSNKSKAEHAGFPVRVCACVCACMYMRERERERMTTYKSFGLASGKVEVLLPEVGMPGYLGVEGL